GEKTYYMCYNRTFIFLIRLCSYLFLFINVRLHAIMYTKHTFKGGYFMSKRSKIYRVEPLRKTDEIEEMRWAIRRGNKGTPKRRELDERDGLIFLMGINKGLRVNDLVRLKVRDVRDGITFQIREGKTDKLREINVGMLQDEIESFIDGKHSDDYLF